ncbi:response regulator transcription factor [Thauera aromatica]|nr:response regulator transcription factor [Thauera aromatica]
MGRSAGAPIEVLLVDDQPAILAGVGALIGSEAPFLHLAGSAGCGRDALELARHLQPDIIVLDVELGGEDGLALVPMFRICCDAAIVVFTYLAAPRVRLRSLYLGAAGFVSKTASGEELIAAIRKVTG